MSNETSGRDRPSPEGEALFAVVLEITQTFFRLRAAGQRSGAVTPWGGGLLGMMRTLALEGPKTVPEIARARPVARQRIQRLANEMAEAGLIEFIDNPAHKRSKLLRLTPKGEREYAALHERMAALCEEIGEGFDPAELRTAADVLRRIRERLRSDEAGG